MMFIEHEHFISILEDHCGFVFDVWCEAYIDIDVCTFHFDMRYLGGMYVVDAPNDLVSDWESERYDC